MAVTVLFPEGADVTVVLDTTTTTYPDDVVVVSEPPVTGAPQVGTADPSGTIPFMEDPTVPPTSWQIVVPAEPATPGSSLPETGDAAAAGAAMAGVSFLLAGAVLVFAARRRHALG